MERRTGIYSGTFDPIHPGHIAFAKESMRLCGLDEVVFLPEQKPRGKQQVTRMEHRVAMIERAIEAVDGLRVMQLASEQFTVRQTLPELRRIFGGSQLTFLIGIDVVRTSLGQWEELNTLLCEVSFAIGLRSNDTPEDIMEVVDDISSRCAMPVEYTLVATPEADMASSHIRHGMVTKSRLFPNVLEYMQKHQLYTQANDE